MKTLECDCPKGTTKLVCYESQMFNARLIDGKIVVDLGGDFKNGLDDFQCAKCGAELDNQTCRLELETING